MKRISIVLLATAVFSLGAMEGGGQELSATLLRQVCELTRTYKQIEAQQGVEVPGELPRTYFAAFGRQPFARVEPKPPCILCYKLGFSREHLDTLPDDDVDKHAVVREFDKGTVLFVNQMPYCDGNCLVMPKSHVKYLRQLSREQRTEYHDVVDCAVPIFMKVFNALGFNTGRNYE